MFGKYKIDDLYVAKLAQVESVSYFGKRPVVNLKPIKWCVFCKRIDKYNREYYVQVTTNKAYMELFSVNSKVGKFVVDQRSVTLLSSMIKDKGIKKVSKDKIQSIENQLNAENNKDESESFEKVYEA